MSTAADTVRLVTATGTIVYRHPVVGCRHRLDGPAYILDAYTSSPVEMYFVWGHDVTEDVRRCGLDAAVAKALMTLPAPTTDW